jgi:hypothetical protein
LALPVVPESITLTVTRVAPDCPGLGENHSMPEVLGDLYMMSSDWKRTRFGLLLSTLMVICWSSSPWPALMPVKST